jgi:hypothetical protein
MYNSFEERALITTLSSNTHVPGVVVGVGSQIPDAVDPARARSKFGLHNPFIIYVGRIDANKGCARPVPEIHRIHGPIEPPSRPRTDSERRYSPSPSIPGSSISDSSRSG